MVGLIKSEPGTCVLTYQFPTDEDDQKQGRIQEFFVSGRYSMAEHIKEQLPGQNNTGTPAGAPDFDNHSLARSPRFFPYPPLELLTCSAAGFRTERHVTGTTGHAEM